MNSTTKARVYDLLRQACFATASADINLAEYEEIQRKLIEIDQSARNQVHYGMLPPPLENVGASVPARDGLITDLIQQAHANAAQAKSSAEHTQEHVERLEGVRGRQLQAKFGRQKDILRAILGAGLWIQDLEYLDSDPITFSRIRVYHPQLRAAFTMTPESAMEISEPRQVAV